MIDLSDLLQLKKQNYMETVNEVVRITEKYKN